ncbi:hypothetical protein D037_2419B, partial [Vibrio parahaemolyticus IDH02640]
HVCFGGLLPSPH